MRLQPAGSRDCVKREGRGGYLYTNLVGVGRESLWEWVSKRVIELGEAALGVGE